MTDSRQTRIQQLRVSIDALQAQRETLGPSIEPALDVLKAELAALEKELASPYPDAASRLAELHRATPSTLAQKILSTRAEGEGQRKPVTILFTDIVGSTALAEKMDPEEWKEIVSGAHRRVSQAVYRYEGTIAQLLGDGVLAFFGAPLTHEDDPVRAVHAAIDIQQSVRAYAQELAGYLDSFQMRIGIHTGIVVVGSVGDDLHMEYLAIGDSVNLAARLQSAAQPGTILISSSTARLVRSAFELESLGEIAIKGKADPVGVWQVAGSRRLPGTGRGIEGLTSPLVGREPELERLCQALRELSSGHGQIVAILGEAGIGKTRLVEEARRLEREEKSELELRWLEGRSLSYGQSLSFWAIGQLIRADLGLADADPEPRIRTVLKRRLGALLGSQAESLLPYLLHLLGVKLEGQATEQIRLLDGETLKRETLRSVVRYLESVADQQPTVLAFEDAHWTDPSTLEALEELLELADRVPLMVLLLLRPERDHGSWRLIQKAETDYAHRYTRLDLKPLSLVDSTHLAQNLLLVADIPDAVRQLILARSEGNPLYLEEIIRSLIEQGAIVTEDGRWRAPLEMPPVEIPETLQGILLARIDRLEEGVRHTLQLASVIGKSFPYRLLQAIDEAERQLDRHLAQLQRADLVREKMRRPELEYIFKHSLTQEAAYNSILLERRREFPRRIGEALEQLFADRREEYYGLLAHHFEAAGDETRAVDYLLNAGDKARFEEAHTEALDYYRRAIALLTVQGDDRRAADTWLKLALVHHMNFDFEDAHRANEEAFALTRQASSKGLRESQDTGHERATPNTLRLGNFLRVINADPGLLSYVGDSIVLRNVLAGLVELDTDLNIVPHVARSWEVLDGGTRYLFHLKDDVRWTDGKPVTAHDFEWSWKRNLAPELTTGRPALREIAGAEAYHNGESPNADGVGVCALDSHTLQVQLVSPVAYMPYIFADPMCLPLPKQAIEQHGEGWWRPEHIVSNGPFRLVQFGEGGAALERNFDYFGEFPGNIDRIELVTESEGEDHLAEYLSGRMNALLYVRRPSALAIPAAETHPYSLLHVGYLLFAPDHPPLDNPRVRQALSLAIDRRALADTEGSGDYPAGGGIIPPGIPGHTPDMGMTQDLEKARRLLAEAGYPSGRGMRPLVLGTGPRSLPYKVDVLVQQWLDNLGIQVVLRRLPPRGALLTDQWDLFTQEWIADYPDPDNFVRSVMYQALRRPGWDVDRFAGLIDAAARASDRGQRMGLYRQADHLWVADDRVILAITYGGYGESAWKPWVRGLRFSRVGHTLFKNVMIDRTSDLDFSTRTPEGAIG